MLNPVNNHLLIEPIKRDDFIPQGDTYQEIGVVIDFDPNINLGLDYEEERVKKGQRVYFDGWLAAKYPRGNDSYYWLVQWNDIRMIEDVEPE